MSPAKLSLSMVASPQSPLPFHLAKPFRDWVRVHRSTGKRHSHSRVRWCAWRCLCRYDVYDSELGGSGPL